MTRTVRRHAFSRTASCHESLVHDREFLELISTLDVEFVGLPPFAKTMRTKLPSSEIQAGFSLTVCIHGLRAKTLAPRTPYFRAVFSFFVPRKQSKWAVTRTSSNPRSPKNDTSSASGRAPAIQPVHRSMLRRTSSPSSASSTMSASWSRPPGRKTRRISTNAFSF